MHSLRLGRRALFQAGAAGVAAASTAAGWRFLEGTAQAARLPAALRRSTWASVTDPDFALAVGDRALPLRLTGVEDLPVAAQIPALRGHDGAFAIRFSGPAGIGQGTYALRHAQLGEISLFVVPVEGEARTRLYEAVVDRTVRIAGVNEEGDPQPVAPPAERAGQPPAMQPASDGSGGSAAASARIRPRLRRATLVRGPGRRVALADLVLADAGAVAAVHAVLLCDGRAVGRASARLRGGRRVRLRFAARGRRLPRARYVLALTLVARDGHVTTIRKGMRFS